VVSPTFQPFCLWEQSSTHWSLGGPNKVLNIFWKSCSYTNILFITQSCHYFLAPCLASLSILRIHSFLLIFILFILNTCSPHNVVWKMQIWKRDVITYQLHWFKISLDVICHFLCSSETTRTLRENLQMPNGNYKEDSSLWNLHISLVYWMRTALFWVITQQVVVISYQRYGISHQSHFRGQCW
jgi:hypothetical protein